MATAEEAAVERAVQATVAVEKKAAEMEAGARAAG